VQDEYGSNRNRNFAHRTIAIDAHDVDRAAPFYQNALGLKLLFKAPPGLAFLDCGGVRLMLSRSEKPEFDHPSSVLYLVVPDIQAAHARMKENGVKFEDEPRLIAKMPDHDLWMTFFRDSEGNLMGLMSEVGEVGTTDAGRCSFAIERPKTQDPTFLLSSQS
jgi:methylmalonyl-CoA/ethylmalonyl-CoA epimerase